MDHIDPSKISYNFDDFHISDTCTHDIDDHFVLDQHADLDFNSACSVK
jgi:hypothetical protein